MSKMETSHKIGVYLPHESSNKAKVDHFTDHNDDQG